MRGLGPILLLSGLMVAGPAAAQSGGPGFGDRRFAEATAKLLITEHLWDRCPEARQTGAPLAAKLQVWEADNHAPQLRRSVETARAQPGGAALYQALQTATAQKMAPADGKACAFLTLWLASPESRMGEAAPAGFAAGGNAAAAAAPRPAPTPPQPTTANPAPSLGQAVQGYGLIQSYGFGYGGMMIVNLEPAILFKSGEVATDISAVAAPGGLEADRRAHPNHWTRWRQTGGVYEFATQSGKWNKFFGDKVWSTPPSMAGLRGVFTHVGGAGNLAIGGTDAVFTQSSFEFLPGGRLIRQGLASGSSEATGGGGTTRTVTNAKSGRAGRYSVDGLTMSVVYDGGGQESLVLMTHPSDPDIIWLNGQSYTRQK